MTDSRRSPGAEEPRPEATRSPGLDELRAQDASLAEFVMAGGLRGFSADQMFPERAA